MLAVKIYINCLQKCPRALDGKYGYVIEFQGKSGPVTREEVGLEEKVTPHQLELLVIVKALKRLIKPCDVTLVGDLMWVQTNSQLIDEWKAKGWVTAQGKEVKNKDLWKEFDVYTKIHKIDFAFCKTHNYTKWIKSECKNLKEE